MSWCQSQSRQQFLGMLSVCVTVASLLLIAASPGLYGQTPQPDDRPTPPHQEADRAVPPQTSQADVLTKDNKEAAEKPRWTSAQIQAGQAAFEARCVQCHDANKSLGISRSLSWWKSTVQRMAAQDGAEIPSREWESISIYLTSQGSESAATGTASESSENAETESSVRLFGTISPTFRSGPESVQNPGFFPDTWLGLNWQSKGALSAKLTSCVTCHESGDDGLGSPIDLVQASMRLDLGMLIRESDGCPALNDVEVSVEAGRFVVPFGAFSSQVNPGVYRTVSRPLIFNMGQRIFDEDLGDPVLPMPYSDEGASFNVSFPLYGDVTAAMDGYVVQGLQGDGSGINFDLSRKYTDNNRTPAIGGRWTLGNQMLKLGTSLMAGRFNENGGTGPSGSGMTYTIMGADATFRYEDLFRIQAEYAQRNTDSFIDMPGKAFGTDRVGGGYVEGELWLFDDLSVLCRWDNQRQHYAALAADSSLPSTRFGVQRWTYGVNWAITGNSLLMFNIERWMTPHGFPDVNVYGLRWAMSF